MMHGYFYIIKLELVFLGGFNVIAVGKSITVGTDKKINSTCMAHV